MKLDSKERNKNKILLLHPLSIISPNRIEMRTGKNLIKKIMRKIEWNSGKATDDQVGAEVTNTSQCETLRTIFFFFNLGHWMICPRKSF